MAPRTPTAMITQQWALLERASQRLIMRGSWATVQRFGRRFIEAGIGVDYRKETQQARKVA